MQSSIAQADKDNIFRGFADFFPLHTPEFAKRVKIISMEEFVDREGGDDGRVPVPASMLENVTASVKSCDKRKNSKSFCGHIADYLAQGGFTPETRAQDGCFVFDRDVYEGRELAPENAKSIAYNCGVSQLE